MNTAVAKFADEIGLRAFIISSRDIKILTLQRFICLTAYGSSTLILVLYLLDLGNSPTRTGLFATLSLLGDVVISLVLTIVADKVGRRRVLAIGSLLMTGSGLAFASSGNYWILLLASILGVITPTGTEIGPFKAIEESIIAQLTRPEDRNSILAWYTLFGTAGVALGSISCGWLVCVLQRKHKWLPVAAYRVIFIAYAILGITKFLLCLFLSQRCEVGLDEHSIPTAPANDVTSEEHPVSTPILMTDADERQPLLANSRNNITKIQSGPFPNAEINTITTSLFPQIPHPTKLLILKLSLLFSMDSLASGLSAPTWTIYLFANKFGLTEETLGTLFFATSIISAISNLATPPLSRRFGLVRTMVLTHAPAAVALAFLPLPSSLVLAMSLLVVRASTNNMDQAPRQAFLAAAVPSEARTSVMGILNTVKTLSRSVGPFIPGKLAGLGRFWVAFVVAGLLKILYDVLLVVMFWGDEMGEDRTDGSNVKSGVEAPRERSSGTEARLDEV